MKICENCGNKHNGFYGSGRFCSTKCARGFSTKAKRKEINEKVKAKLTGFEHYNRRAKKITKICLVCKKEFEVKDTKNGRKRICCNNKCSSNLVMD